MSLTKSDLKQIKEVVGNVVDERLEVKLEEKFDQFEIKLEHKFDQKLETKLEKKLKPIKKDLNYIRKTVDILVKDYDERDVKLSKRVDRIGLHLSLPKEN